MLSETYIRLTAITQSSAERLFNVVDQKLRSGTQRFHLLLSAIGGNAVHGISIYHFLKGIPAEIITYNFGTVDSIGITIFCSGNKRISVPNARFFLHPAGMDVRKPTRIDDHWLREHRESLKIDHENVAKIIAFETRRDYQSVLHDIGERKSLNPDEAVTYGLVHETGSNLLPIDADFVPIYESEINYQLPHARFSSVPEGIIARFQVASVV